jgi:solute carrier family 25 protein 45/47
MGFPLLTSGALNSLFFGVYGNSLRALESSHKQHNPDNSEVSKYWYTNVFLAGAFAGTVQVAVATPIELVKIQLQSQTGTFRFSDTAKFTQLNAYLLLTNQNVL